MKLHVENFGPIGKADIILGDLNVSVGPHGSGKSLFWQLLKLLLDAPAVREKFLKHNIDWDLYFGQGMKHLVGESTVIHADGQERRLDGKLFGRKGAHRESLFYIPAQRAMALSCGLTRSFTEYHYGDPYAVRDFSDKLHWLVQTEFVLVDKLFPQVNRLGEHLRELIDGAFFHGFSLELTRDTSFFRKLVLRKGDIRLPFVAWASGQREFLPLLLGLYWLMPAEKARRDDVSWVVIEEPEIGLHPNAILVFMALALELLHRGYRVCLSTHSPLVMDVVWALQTFKRYGGTVDDVLRVFGLPSNGKTKEMAQSALNKDIRVNYFKPGAGVIDISNLDLGATSTDMAGWGGLLESSANVGNAVAEVMTRAASE